jgi:hypothetical protein
MYLNLIFKVFPGYASPFHHYPPSAAAGVSSLGAASSAGAMVDFAGHFPTAMAYFPVMEQQPPKLGEQLAGISAAAASSMSAAAGWNAWPDHGNYFPGLYGAHQHFGTAGYPTAGQHFPGQ